MNPLSLIFAIACFAVAAQSSEPAVMFRCTEIPPNPGGGAPEHSYAFRTEPDGHFVATYKVAAFGPSKGTSREKKGVLTVEERKQLASAIERSSVDELADGTIRIPGGGIENGSSGILVVSGNNGEKAVRFATAPFAVKPDTKSEKLLTLVSILKTFAVEKSK